MGRDEQCPLVTCVPALSPSLPIKARYQEVVTATNPNQACSTAPLGTRALLHGVKVTVPAQRELGVRAGARGREGSCTPSSPAHPCHCDHTCSGLGLCRGS